MPYKPSRQCSGKGTYYRRCTYLAKGNDQYCPRCSEIFQKELKQQNKKYDQNRDQSKERHFIHSVQWRKIRLMKLVQDPICEECLKENKEIQAILVHHVDGNELNNPGDGSNWLSMCNDCHEKIHKKDRWNKY